MNSRPEPYLLEPLPAYREYPQPEIIEQCLLAAGTAMSGANQQYWFFSVITDPNHKRRVREAAEVEERSS